MIPSTFSIVAENKNFKSNSYTYIDKELNVSARIALDIDVLNAKGDICKNFDKDSWNHDINISLGYTRTDTPTIINTTINAKLPFEDGKISLSSDDVNRSKNMIYNFTRESNSSLNPFKVLGSDIKVSVKSKYSTDSVVSNEVSSEHNTTFLYAKAHIGRTSIAGNEGVANVYFENFCYGKDSLNRDCNKSLLPDGTTAKYRDDPRWFVNTQHDANLGTVTSYKDAKNNIDFNKTDFTVGLKYNERYGYPYKTKVIYYIPNRLYYNKYGKVDENRSDFSADFYNKHIEWSGHHKTNSTTESKASIPTSRRTMW
jgi:hypothetical protein